MSDSDRTAAVAEPRRSSSRGAPSVAGRAVAELAVFLLAGLLAEAQPGAAKVAGSVHCHRSVCHRIHSVEETRQLVGTTRLLEASAYDDPEIDSYNKNEFTSDGERFDGDSPYRVASSDLPDGTLLLLRNPENGRTSHVRVNDLGPFYNSRRIDATRRVAQDLRFLKKGSAVLEVTVLAVPRPEDLVYKKDRRGSGALGYIGTVEAEQIRGLIDRLVGPQSVSLAMLRRELAATRAQPLVAAALPVTPGGTSGAIAVAGLSDDVTPREDTRVAARSDVEAATPGADGDFLSQGAGLRGGAAASVRVAGLHDTAGPARMEGDPTPVHIAGFSLDQPALAQASGLSQGGEAEPAAPARDAVGGAASASALQASVPGRGETEREVASPPSEELALPRVIASTAPAAGVRPGPVQEHTPVEVSLADLSLAKAWPASHDGMVWALCAAALTAALMAAALVRRTSQQGEACVASGTAARAVRLHRRVGIEDHGEASVPTGPAVRERPEVERGTDANPDGPVPMPVDAVTRQGGLAAPPSCIGEDLFLAGTVRAKGLLLIAGRVEGRIEATEVRIGRSGVVVADIVADVVVVAGRLGGQVVAGSFEAQAGAWVDAEILADALMVDAGACVEGTIRRRTHDAGGAVQHGGAARVNPMLMRVA